MPMSEERRRSLATAGVGLGGVAVGGAMREAGISRALRATGDERSKVPARALIRKLPSGTKARKLYLAGTTLGALSTAPAVIGLHRTVKPKEPEELVKRARDLAYEGLAGSAEALNERRAGATDQVKDRTGLGAKAQALAAAGGVGGGLVGAQAGHKLLDRTGRAVPRKLRAATTAVTGTLGIAASIPATNAIAQRKYGYEVTATGVRRAKTKIKRPTSLSDVQTRQMPREFGKAAVDLPWPGMSRGRFERVFRTTSKKKKGREQLVPAHHLQSVMWDAPRGGEKYHNELKSKIKTEGQKAPILVQSKLASGYGGPDVSDGHHRARAIMDLGGKARVRVSTVGDHKRFEQEYKATRSMRNKANRREQWDHPALVGWNKRYPHLQRKSLETPDGIKRVKKADIPDYAGRDLTPGQKRARVMSSGTLPIVGDFAAAGQAARLAPPHQRKQAAISQYAGGVGGQVTGGLTGAYAAAALARRNPKIEEISRPVDTKIKDIKGKIKEKARIPDQRSPRVDALRGKMERTKFGSKMAGKFKGAPAAVALGALGGSMVGAQIGGYTGYGHALRQERKYKESLTKFQPMTEGERRKAIRRKQRNAGLSAAGATIGATGLGLLGSSKVKALSSVRRAKLKNASTTTVVIGAGLGAINSADWAHTQHKEAKQLAKKAWSGPTGLVKVKGYQASHFRRPRTLGAQPIRVKAGVR